MTIRTVLRALLHPGPQSEALARPPVDPSLAAPLHRSLQLRHVDAGSCNGCELELHSIFSPVYDAERFGVRVVASPRHADALIVSGPVTKNMAGPLAKTHAALPEPGLVVSLGDCAGDCGVFRGAYGVVGSVGDVLAVDVHIAGCPPRPEAIIEALRGLSDQ
jgi:Ni,Fe-hydrogenase III small subunit